MKRIYWILTSISLYSLLSCSNGAKDTQEYQTVKTDTVVSAGGQTSLQYPGKVKAAQDISLAFRVSGTIQKIYVKDGARVQVGQLLAELVPTGATRCNWTPPRPNTNRLRQRRNA